MKFVAALTAFLATAEARCFSQSCKDSNPYYAECVFNRNYHESGSVPRVYPRGSALGTQAAPGDPVTIHIEVDNLDDDTAYAVKTIDITDGTSDFDGRTCEKSIAAGAVTAPTESADVVTGTSTSRGDLEYQTTTTTTFSIHRDTGTDGSLSPVEEGLVFFGIYDGADLVACCEWDTLDERGFNYELSRMDIP